MRVWVRREREKTTCFARTEGRTPESAAREVMSSTEYSAIDRRASRLRADSMRSVKRAVVVKYVSQACALLEKCAGVVGTFSPSWGFSAGGGAHGGGCSSV